MPDAGSLKSALARLASPDVFAEIVAIVIAVLIALVGARLMRAWQKRRDARGEVFGWRGRIAEGAVVLTPFALALAVMLIVRGVLGTMSMHTAVVDTVLQLIAALVLVRLGMYLLRMWLGADGWLRIWETRLTFILWVMISFQLLGWFSYAEGTLDAVDIIPGKKVFSLWDLLRVIVAMTGFVLATSLIARTI